MAVVYGFEPEQEALRRTAKAYLDKHHPIDRLRDEEPRTPDEQAWPALVDLGWLEPTLGCVELGLIAEETGYALLGGAWWPTVALAAPALAGMNRSLPRPATLAWQDERMSMLDLGGAACTAECAGSRMLLHGTKTGVPWSSDVREVVVVAHEAATNAGQDPLVGLYLVDVEGQASRSVQVATRMGIDPTRQSADIRLDAAPAVALVRAGEAGAVLRRIRARSFTLLACEAIGVARRALDIAVTHAGARKQFGRSIGSFQAVSHPLADVYAGIELARSLAYRAAWVVDNEPEVTELDAWAAAIASREAVLDSCEVAIQTLGAIGLTWEHPLHRFYRRALWIATFGQPSSELREQVAAHVMTRAAWAVT